MSKLKLTGKDLMEWGFTEGRIIGKTLEIVRKVYKHSDIEDVKTILVNLLNNYESFLGHDTLAPIAEMLMPVIDNTPKEIALRETGVPYKVYGRDDIEKGAIDQMDIASMLPVTVTGALMPDAHAGYGLPIGGVLATENAIIPYAVGVDIGCRMCLTIYDENATYIDGNRNKLKNALISNTFFGAGCETDKPRDHEIFDKKEFTEIRSVHALKDRAWKQLGTSGGGNHFVDIGIVKIVEANNDFGLAPGEYVGILSHSGSRGFGANIADKYTRIAMDKTRLPKEAKHLAWLDMNSEEGLEYWIAMNLAGDYAQACHDEIHQRLAKSLGIKPVAKVDNHHNFAWKEMVNGKELIVHRKGATPAGLGVLGIIPGSMVSDAFIVRGKGVTDSISSASHGAGRLMSRTKAKSSITKSSIDKILKEHKVTLIGGGIDEAPFAYKDIYKVMEAQQNLIDIVGTFRPQVVRMAQD